MPRPETASVSLRKDLSAVANEFDASSAAARFIGPLAAPRFNVPEQAGNYPILNREDFRKPANTARKDGAAYNRIEGQFATGTWSCDEHGLEYVIDDRRRRRFASFIDAEQAAARILRHQILLAYERRVAALYSGASLTANKAATAWSTSADGVPLSDLLTGMETLEDNCGTDRSQLSLIIPRDAFREALACAQVVDKIKYTYPGIQPALLAPALFAAMLGIKGVLIASGSYDSTEEGYAESIAQVWTAGYMYLALLADPDDPLEIPSAMRTMIWTADAAEIPIVESYRDESRRGDVIRMRDDTDEVETAAANLMAYELSADAS